MIRLLLTEFYHSKRFYSKLPGYLFDEFERAFIAGFDHILVTKEEYSQITR